MFPSPSQGLFLHPIDLLIWGLKSFSQFNHLVPFYYFTVLHVSDLLNK